MASQTTNAPATYPVVSRLIASFQSNAVRFKVGWLEHVTQKATTARNRGRTSRLKDFTQRIRLGNHNQRLECHPASGWMAQDFTRRLPQHEVAEKVNRRADLISLRIDPIDNVLRLGSQQLNELPLQISFRPV
jgi:hypothetical protein